MNDILSKDYVDSRDYKRVEFCSLAENSILLDNQRIEITAILITGREYTYLYDPTCTEDRNFVYYEFFNENIGDKFGEIIRPENEEYRKVGLIRARATFRGQFFTKRDEGFGHLGFADHELVIEDAIQVSKVALEVPYPW